MEAVRGIICTQVRKGILGQVGNARSQKGRWVGPRYLTFDCPEESPYFRVEARERKRPRHGALLDCDHKLASPPSFVEMLPGIIRCIEIPPESSSSV